MEEDIINELINKIKERKDKIRWTNGECDYDKYINALENLLTRYEQLEEENKELKKVKSDELIINNPWLFEYLNELYIFKGKVKEKIEELSNEEDIKYILSKTNRIIYKIDIIDILQELLREE